MHARRGTARAALQKTFIFNDFDYVGGNFYKNMVQIGKCITLNQARGIFGFQDTDPIAKIAFPPVQVCGVRTWLGHSQSVTHD